MKYVVILQGNEYPIADKFISKFNLKPGDRTPFTNLLILNERCLNCCNVGCEFSK